MRKKNRHDEINEGLMIVSICALVLFLMLEYMIEGLHLNITYWFLGLSFGVAFVSRYN